MSEYIVELNSNVVSGGKFLLGTVYLDTEEIVGCRDCKHFTPKGTYKFENGKVNADCCEYIRGWILQITPDGFCKWGERKEGRKE